MDIEGLVDARIAGTPLLGCEDMDNDNDVDNADITKFVCRMISCHPSALVGAGCALGCGVTPPNAGCLTEHSDPFATQSDIGNPSTETAIEFGTSDMPAIPANFFFTGSAPFTGRVPLVGVPIKDCLGLTDTIVQRSGPLMFPGSGFPRPSNVVTVTINDLTMTAPNSILVNGQEWLVAMTLTNSQMPGTMQATLDSPLGGTFMANVPVNPAVAFARKADVLAHIGGGGFNPATSMRILDWNSSGFAPVQLGFNTPMPFSTVPPGDGSFFCSNELSQTNPFFAGVQPGGLLNAEAGGLTPRAGLPPHVPPGSPGAAHFIMPPPPPPPGLCSYLLFGSFLFPPGCPCPAPLAVKLMLVCPAATGAVPPCPPLLVPPCPAVIIVIFPCPPGFCISIYVAAGCCTC
jgi:hypothetical protein